MIEMPINTFPQNTNICLNISQSFILAVFSICYQELCSSNIVPLLLGNFQRSFSFSLSSIIKLHRILGSRLGRELLDWVDNIYKYTDTLYHSLCYIESRDLLNLRKGEGWINFRYWYFLPHHIHIPSAFPLICCLSWPHGTHLPEYPLDVLWLWITKGLLPSKLIF